MKKTYIIPSQKMAELEVGSLLCESDITTYNEMGDGVQLVKEEENSLTSSKNLWDNLW